MPAGRYPVVKKKRPPLEVTTDANRGAGRPVAAPAQPAPKKRIVSPDDRSFDRSVGLKPLPRPNSLLQQYGYQGSTQDFVARIHEVTKAHEEAFGYKPAPGFAFDLARFHSPFSTLDLLTHGNRPEPQPEQTPFYKAVQAAHNEPPAGAIGPAVKPGIPPVGVQGPAVPLTEKYPTVTAQMGVLPIAHGDAVEKFFKYANELGGAGDLPVREQGQSLKDYGKMLQLSGDKAAFGPQGQRNQAAIDKREFGKSITDMFSAQEELNKEMGTKLPVTGIMNRDWLKAIANWMQSEDYFKAVVKKQANDAGYDNPQQFVNAWKTKKKAVESSGWSAHFFNALPIQMYDHGFDPLGMARSEVEYVTSDGKMFYSPTSSLHTLTRSASIALGAVGGGLEQGKANLTAVNAFMRAVAPKGMPVIGFGLPTRGKGESYEQAKARMHKVLKEHPSWVRVLFPEIGKGGDTRLAEAANLAGDLILLRKPTLTGERVAAGSIEAAQKSTYLNYAGHWAFEDLAKGDIGRAAARMEGNKGAEQLAARAAPLIRSGKMTREEFKSKLAELYAFGQTDITVGSKTHTVSGPVLASLRGPELPTPGKAGTTWLRAKQGMRQSMDNLDAALKSSKIPWTDGASKFITGLRAEFQHYVQSGPHYLYDPKMAERIHDYVLRETRDAKLATEYENRFVSMRAKENFSGLAKLQQELTEKYNMKFPLRKGGGRAEPFDAKLATEGPSMFHFPQGGEREIDGAFSALAETGRKINRVLTLGAMGHARIILGLPFQGWSLFYKHMIADTGRRAVAEEGFIGGRTSEMRRAKGEIEQLANSNPQYSRLLGTFRKRSVESEQRWLLNKGGRPEASPSFRTLDKAGKGNYMDAAGAYLRRRLDDNGLNAYRESVATGSDKPLVDLVLNDKTYRGMWKAARKEEPTLTAEEYADKVFGDFREVENGLHGAGFTFDDALAVLRKYRGVKADKELGKFIEKNSIDFEVRSPQVTRMHPFDSATSWWIGKLMTFNKWNRGQLAQRTLEKTYAQLTKAGMEKGPALEVAADYAERVVTHHMLDFANRLQIEQDLRWVAYFATKHRLYWKWVVGTLLRRPGVALVARDVQNALGGDGEANFSAFGHDWKVPLARLMWIPGKEYSENSPLLLALQGLAKGGPAGMFDQAVGNYGNVFTRNDTTVRYGVKLLKINRGFAPATYGYATAGLDDRSKAFLNFQINNFQNDYYQEHGHFASESEAVKWALAHQMASEAWRANLPLPVLPDYGENEGQQLLRKFQALRDPAKRRNFLDDHPQLSLYFGIYRDPKQYTHVRPLWEAYTTAIDRRDTDRARLFEEARKSGFTPEMQLKRRAIDKEFNRVFKQLLAKDLAGTPEADRKELNGQKYGWWGQQVADDPLADPRKTLKQLFPNLKVSGVPGKIVKELRLELTQLNDPKYVAQTFEDPADARSRKAEILQQLEVFNAYPKDALGRVERDYQQKYVGQYWNEYTKKVQAIDAMPKNQKDVAYAELKAWKDEQDHPVTINGVKFPSPLRMAWATMDPVTKKARLAQIASGSWESLADYEKELLGKKVPPDTSKKWAFFDEQLARWREQYNLQGHNVPKNAKDYLAKQIEKMPGGAGFYKDYLFSKQPAYVRIRGLTPITESKHRADWVKLLEFAKSSKHELDNAKTPSTAAHAWWRKVVDQSLKPELDSPENRAFRREVDLFGPDFLYTLIF